MRKGDAVGRGIPARTLLFLAFSGAAWGQDGVHVPVQALTSWQRALLAGYGDHFQAAGKERSVMNGQFVRAGGGPAAATVTKQLPDQVRLEGFSASGKPQTFAGYGKSASGTANADDLDVLETFYADTPELFFLGRQQGVAYRMIGSHYRGDDGTAANYAGPWYDVYQLAVPLDFRGQKGAVRWKTFAFDTSHGWLAAVNYQIPKNGSTVNVKIEYSGWTATGGQASPGMVRRLEDGTEVWRLNVTGASYAPSVADGLFAAP